MEDKDLPELNIPRYDDGETKKRKKKGFLPWLTGQGGRSAGGAMARGGSGAFGAGASGAAGAAGAGGVGGTGFLATLFAGKMGALAVTAAITLGALGIGYIASNLGSKTPDGSGNVAQSNSDYDSRPSNYVPAIERVKNRASSLDMVADANKSKIGDVDPDAILPKKEEAKEEKPVASADAAAEQPAGDNMSQQMGQKLLGGNYGALSSSTSGGMNSKYSAGKVGFNGVMGSFQKPSFKSGQLSAMRQTSGTKPVAARQTRASYGKGARNQAKGIGGSLARKTGLSSADGARGALDQAWEGQTGTGDAGTSAGGTGVGGSSLDGGGVVTSPSLDNTPSNISTGSTGTSSIGTTTTADVTPWHKMVMMTSILLLVANILLILEAIFSNTQFLKGIAAILNGFVMIIGAMVTVMGVMMMTTFGQKLGGGILTASGAMTMVAAGMAMAGKATNMVTVGLAIASSIGSIMAMKMSK